MFYINHNNFIYNNNCAKVIFTDKLSVDNRNYISKATLVDVNCRVYHVITI